LRVQPLRKSDELVAKARQTYLSPTGGYRRLLKASALSLVAVTSVLHELRTVASACRCCLPRWPLGGEIIQVCFRAAACWRSIKNGGFRALDDEPGAGHLVKFQDRSSYGQSGIQNTLDTTKAPSGDCRIVVRDRAIFGYTNRARAYGTHRKGGLHRRCLRRPFPSNPRSWKRRQSRGRSLYVQYDFQDRLDA